MDEVVSVDMPAAGMAQVVVTKRHRVLRFASGSEQMTVFSWHPTDRIRICLTDIAGLYAITDLDAQPFEKGTAHGKLVSGPRP